MIKLPPWVTHHKKKEEQEAQEYAALTPEERLARFAQIVRLSWAIFSQNPQQKIAIELRDERSPESLLLWQRLMKTRPYHG